LNLRSNSHTQPRSAV